MSAALAVARPRGRIAQPARALVAFGRHPGAAVGLAILVVLVLAALAAPAIAPYDSAETDVAAHLSPPDADFWFGSDLYGRDIFSRVVWGGRYSLAVGLATVAFAVVLGSSAGIAIGYAGGRVDAIGVRAIDVLMGFPSIIMAILVVMVLGVGLPNVVVAVGIAQVPRFARVIRSTVLALREHPFVEAARAVGAGWRRVMARHLLPNVVPTLIVLATLNLGDAILQTATLSFLGLGAQPPTPEWGTMLSEGRDYIRYAPWMMIFPGMALFLTAISINLVGDRLSHLLDPRNRGRT